MCPEIIIMSSLTQQLFNSGYDKMTTFKKIHDVACFSQLNTTWKGKLINQLNQTLECILHLSEYIYTVIIVQYIKYLCL